MSDATSVRIEPARPEDSQHVRHLVRAAYAKWVPVIGREPLPMQADYERAIREHAVDLMFAGNELVALIEIIMEPDHIFIENVAVMPDHQSRGYGRQLLAHAERKAKDAGLVEIRLLTNGAFDANVKFYQSIGFRVDRTEPFMGGTTVYMSKAITA